MGDIKTVFQGALQGSRAALVLWLIMSIFLMHYLCSKNLQSHVITPTLGVVMLLVVLMFIDDTDLYIINSGSDKTEGIVDEA